MDGDEVEVHKNTKRELAILTELAWSIKGLLYGINNTEKKMIFVLVYFRAPKRKPNMCISDGACPYVLIG